jgi:hypothetical protein
MVDNLVNIHFPGIPCQGDSHVLGVVLMQGQRGEYAAYQGIVPKAGLGKSDSRGRAAACHWIATWGQKLRHDEAVVHFPLIKASEYRA